MSALFSTNRRNRGRAPLRMLGIAMTVFLLLSVLTPLMQPAAAEDAVDPEITDIALQEDPNADPEGQGSGDEFQSQDDVVPEEDLEGIYVDEAPPAEPVGFYINKHDCPSDFGGDYYELAANCGEPSYSTEWTVYGPNYTQFFNGDFGADGLESGVFQIREIMGNGFAEPIVYCKLSDYLGNDAGSYRAITYDGYYEVQIDPGLTLYCDWFNHPLEPVGGGAVMINKHFCDAGFDAYSATIYDMASYCQTQEPGVSFEIFANGASFGTQVTGGDAVVGFVQFNEVPSGALSIYEGGMDGYGEPVIYCNFTDATQAETGFQKFSVGFDSAYYIEAQVGYGEVLYCDWYNIPTHDEYGSVTVIKYECPEVLSHEATVGDYQYECWQPQADVDFKLTSDSTGDPGNYLTDANGEVTWGEREADHYYVTETIPTGYGAPIVYCDTYFPFDEQVPEFFGYEVSAEGRIEFDLEEGQYIICHWFNIPTGDDGDIIVIKHTCDEFDGGEYSYEYLLEECWEVTDGIPYSLELQGNDYLEWSTTGDYEPGSASFDGLGEGTYSLTEDKPEGYGTPIVFCQRYVEEGGGVTEYTEYSASDLDSIEFELGEYEGIVCHWFNVPTYEHSAVTVHKFICDEYVPLDEDQGYYQENCTVAHEGVSFNLNGESTGDQGAEVTDGDGNAAWDGLDTDLYTLDEEIPSGYGEPIVFCGFTAFYNGAVYDGFPVRVDAVYDGAVELDIEIPNSTYFCWYYNIPTDDSSITIYKWLCPATFDLYDDAEATCAEPLNGVTFTADGPDGYFTQSDTGDVIPSAVQFGSLEAGHYEIAETLPSGIAYGFVASCWGNSNPVPAVYPLYHTEWGGAFNIELAKGDQVSCTWYNVPEHHEDDGKLTVVKYLCSGYVVSELTCDLYRDGQAFRLTAASGEGDPIDFETGADGTKTLALPAGTWNLDEIGGEWCKAESYDLNEYGQIVTTAGDESVVSIYNCTPPTKTPPVKQPPTKQGPPITEFPNTGSGATAMAAGLSGSDLAGQGLILLLVAQGLVLIVLRRGGVLGFAIRDNR